MSDATSSDGLDLPESLQVELHGRIAVLRLSPPAERNGPNDATIL